MKLLKDIELIATIRANIQVAANCAPENEIIAGFQTQTLNSLWRENDIWHQLPEGIVRVDFDNGIVLDRNVDYEDGAVWDLTDLNIFFGRRCKKDKIPWDVIVPRKKVG